MQKLRPVGLGLTVLSIAAYITGLWNAYPGRSLSLTAFMVGVTLAAIGGTE